MGPVGSSSGDRSPPDQSGGFVDRIMETQVVWREATVDIADLPDLRANNISTYTDLSNDVRLGLVVAALESGKHTRDRDWESNYRTLLAEFDPSQSRGRPCLLAERESGPYVIFEGTTRLCVLLTLHRAKGIDPSPAPVYLGIKKAGTIWPL